MSGFEVIAALGTLASVGGTIVGAVGAKNQAEYQADIAEQQRDEAKAVSQREASRRAKEARYVLSRQQALSASSGGGGTDPTILDLMGDVAGEGAYQQQSALYEGNARASGFQAQAALSRMSGRQAMLGGFIDAGSTMLSGLSGWSRFRGTAPQGLTYG